MENQKTQQFSRFYIKKNKLKTNDHDNKNSNFSDLNFTVTG